MIGFRAWRSIAAGSAIGSTLILLLAIVGGGAVAIRALAAQRDPEVTVQLLGVAPSTPTAGKPITFTASITNTSTDTLTGLAIHGVRSAPLGTTTQLANAFTKPVVPDPNFGSQSTAVDPIRGTLSPGQSLRVNFKVTTSDGDNSDLCLCGDGIYPYDLVVTANSSDGQVEVGRTQTYIPSLIDTPTPVQVSWLWPLLERPHRLLSQDVFTDDDLARSVAPGGRLYRALQVAVEIAGRVHLTLVIDPELIDELAVMSTGYRVQTGNKVVPGSGTQAARAWLTELRSVLPSYEVAITPFADPDVDAAARAGVDWTSTMPADMAQRVRAALGYAPTAALPSQVVWPAGGTIRPDIAEQLASTGAKVFVLGDGTLTGALGQDPPASAVAPLSDAPDSAKAVVTDHLVQAQVSAALLGGAALPRLVALLAMRAVQAPDAGSYVVIAPDRNVNAPVPSAVSAILDSAAAKWSRSLSVGQAADHIVPVAHGQITQPASAQAAEVPESITAVASAASAFATSFTTALSTKDAATLLGLVPVAVQRLTSSAWRVQPDVGSQMATSLSGYVDGLRSGVSVVKPARGVYSLTSSDAPLPVTVHNSLRVDVKVRVQVTTVKNIAGLTTDDIGVIRVPAGTDKHLKIPTHVQRSGRFDVEVTAVTPDGTPLGEQVPLTVHSSALGVIGVVITAVAGGILVIALAVRVARRMRAKGQNSPPPAGPGTPDSGESRTPVGVGS